jgi:hypothetical protein
MQSKAMGIETLTKAAEAAGYVMAGHPDDPGETPRPVTPVHALAPRPNLPALLAPPAVRAQPVSATQWLKETIGSAIGRGAPA